MMHRLLLIAWLLVPAWAMAKPTLALAPIEGDKDGKVAELISSAVDEDFKVVGPAKVEATMGKLDIDSVDPKTTKKLRKKLGAEVVVYGRVDKEGKKKNLTLSISARGKRTQKFEVDYKSADAKSFKKELRAELNKRLAGAERDESNDDDEDDEREDKREARRDDDDGDRVRKRRDRDDDDDDDRPKKKKKKRHVINHAALRLSAGAVAARRTLTYDGGGMAGPPRVGTFGGAGRIDVEVYPAAFDTLEGAAAGIGFAGELEKTVGVSIDVPGSTKSTPINQMRYSAGVRYRIPFGPSSFAFGASYWYRQFVADRSSLGGLEALDMPDVKYKAIAPTGVLRIAAAPNVGIYFSAEIPLLLDAGPIQNGANYGPASVIAFDLEAGAEILVGSNYAVRLAGQFEQLGLSFSKMNRGVTAAKDRLMGVTATFEVLY